tara:strand:- start:651 stop:1019 length:369 start_codon:yes stop_codon:yes gene_type:complete
MAQDKKKSAAQIAGENEVLGAPDKPDPDFAAAMAAQQAEVDAGFRDDIMFEGNQDPSLRGTGQPGELYGTPTEPDPDFVKEVEAQKQMIKNAAQQDVAKSFDLFDIAEDLGLKFQKFKNEEE